VFATTLPVGSGHPSTLILTLTIAGTFAFGLSGGLAGVRRGLDLFGVAVIAVAAAMAGGVIRDLLIGIPPQGFRDWRYIVSAGAAGLVCFVFYRLFDRLDGPIQLFNALGLSLFCVTGTTAALADGVAPFQAAILGAMTGIGGGVMRDILLGETPVVLRRNLRAIPALLGAAIVATAHAAGLDSGIFAIIGGTACLALWAVGSRFGLELPTIGPDRQRQDPTGEGRSENANQGLMPTNRPTDHEVADPPTPQTPYASSARPRKTQGKSSGEQGNDRYDARILNPRPSIHRRDRGLRD
jgi:uncharacterized membrane protein YeiH